MNSKGLLLGMFLGIVACVGGSLAFKSCEKPAHAGMTNGITDHTARMADALERIAAQLEKKR